MSVSLAPVETEGVDDSSEAHRMQSAIHDPDNEQGSPSEGTRARGSIGSRPGSELAIYVEQTAPGKFAICQQSLFHSIRVSKVLFLCYLRALWMPPTEDMRHQYGLDPASRTADEMEDAGDMIALMLGKKYKQSHADWIAIENFAAKYHTNSRFGKWVSWCGDMATKICAASAQERPALIQEAISTPNEPLPVAILKSLRQSCERAVGAFKDYGTPESGPILIPGQSDFFESPTCTCFQQAQMF